MRNFLLPFIITSVCLALTLPLLLIVFRKLRKLSRNAASWRDEALKRAEMTGHGEREWQTLFDGVPDGVVIQQDNVVVAGNNAFAYMLGVEPQDIVGTDLSRLISREERQSLTDAIEKVRLDVETPKLHLKLRTFMGDLQQVVVTVTHGLYQGSRCELIFFTASHEKAQLGSPSFVKESYFTDVMEELDPMVALFDMHGILQWSNASWRSFWGVSNNMTPSSYSLFHDTNYNSKELSTALLQSVSGSAARINSVSMSSPKGNSKTLSLRFVPVFNIESNHTIQSGFGLIQVDVSEEQRLKNDLKTSGELAQKTSLRLHELVDRQNDIFDSLPGVLVTISNHGIITYWNNDAEVHFDILRTHALGQPVHILSTVFPGLEGSIAQTIKEKRTMRLASGPDELAMLCPCASGRAVILRIFSRRIWNKS